MTNVVLHPHRPVMLFPDTSDVARFLRNVKASKVIETNGQLMLAAPHTSDTVAATRRMGLTVPSATRYSWPGRYKPFDHQRVTAEFLTLNYRNLCLNDMGTGKTASALWAMDHLKQEGLVRKVLVVCPLSTMRVTWEREVFNVTPSRTVGILHGPRAKRLQMVKELDVDIFMVNHDGLHIVADALAARGDIDLIVYDEATAIKDPRSRRFRQLKELVQRIAPRLWLLTGTPTPNAPSDCWSMGRLVNPFNAETNPQGMPLSFTRFKDMVEVKVSSFKWRPRANAQAVVRTYLQPAVRFKKEDCIQLPSVTYMDREVQLSGEQARSYFEMERSLKAETFDELGNGVVVSAVNAAVKMSKLLQICCGSVYGEYGKFANISMPDRLNVLEECINQSDRKVIVFVSFRRALDRVSEYLTKQGITNAVISGDVTGKARDTILTAFMDNDDPKVLVAQPKTASHGLNLTCADTIIWFNPIFSTEQYTQANERMARPGQTHKMSIIHLGANKLEWGAYGILRDRERQQAGILKLYEETLGV
jgi:SNF2 family DNA or RNA helicase